MTVSSHPDAFERWYFTLMAPAGRTRWMRADLLIVGLVAVGAVHSAFKTTAGLVPGVLPSLAIAAVITAGFLWRRQAPLPVALLTMAGLALTGARLPVFFALYGLARYQRRHRPAVIAFCCAAFVPLMVLLPGHLGDSLLEDFLIAVVYVLLPVVFGLVATAYERSITALRDERERRVAQTRAEERVRLAREMHDVLGHRIAIIAMHAGAIEFVPGVKPESRQLARAVGDTARAAMRDLRQVLGALRDGGDSVIAGHCLADLDALVTEARTSGLDVAFACEAAGPVPPEIALTAYRTVQEALTNAVKHAPGAEAEVRVAVTDGALEVRVRNAPVHPSKVRGAAVGGGGFGMMGLRERVSLLSGDFHAGQTRDGGWQVSISVPLNVPCPQP
ncbi:sensor histidine kinase [Streptomyces sp. NPDC050485]|uniref:sensor histidine kinase n=1 Tax=Streptomyces sp. NPDC050485 TaxID=3365617 RepID=UPI0037A3F190